MVNKKMRIAAKKWDTFIKISGDVFQIVGFMCIVLAILTVAFGNHFSIDNSITLDFIKMYLADEVSVNQNVTKIYHVLGLVMVGVICFMVTFVAKIIRKILASITEGRPFEENIPNHLKKIAWMVLGGGLLTQIIGIVERIILLQGFPMEQIISMDAVAKIEYTFVFDFSFVIVFGVIMFLSYIFTYGRDLQRESDETL